VSYEGKPCGSRFLLTEGPSLTKILFMESTKLSTRGQVVIPLAIREKLGLEPGTEFMVQEQRNGVLLEFKHPPKKRKASEVFGTLRRFSNERVSLDDMQEAVVRGAIESDQSKVSRKTKK
jgi:AbrB family looped-hinge helix DNA binding protein